MEKMLVIVTDTAPLGEALERIIRRSVGSSVDVVRIVYNSDNYQSHIGAYAADADYFVVDLLRNYPGGLRAEGVILGERMLLRGKNVMIVSCLSLGDKLSIPFYWDVASSDSFAERVTQLIQQDKIGFHEDIEKLKRVFQKLLVLPPQHKN